MAELLRLISKRKALRTKVTTCFNRRVNFEQNTATQRAAEKFKILEFKDELLKLDKSIQDLKFSDAVEFGDSDLDREMETCADYHEKIQDCLAILNSLSTASATIVQVEAARSLLKQPTAPLPTFSGKDEEDLSKFLREFELTTSSFRYPDRDLLLLLIQQCSGNARTLLQSLEADKQSYQSAKDLLISAFASERKRKFSTINKLTELCLSYHDDPFEYISKVKMICESVKSLKIESNDVVQFFVWKGLNKTFQTHLTQITSETIPSLSQILENFFDANERYQQTQKSIKNKKQTSHAFKDIPVKDRSIYAVGVKHKKSPSPQACSLCSESGHKYFKCPRFPASRDKYEKIKVMGGCTKCGRLNHNVDRCRVVLQSRCYKCKEWHLSSLCPRDSVGAQSLGEGAKPDPVKVETNTRVAVLPCYNSGSILPTFSFSIKGKTFRGLSDRASEGSFISENVAKSLKLKVLQRNIKLTVSGFNKSQEYLSSLVLVPLDLAGVKCDMHALVVPDIQMNLSLPNIGKVVKAFKEKGYMLADTFLAQDSKDICNLDFVLGADFGNLLTGKDVSFGKHSIYIDSNIGTLLIGNVDRVTVDLCSLPHNHREVSNNMVALPSSLDNKPSYVVNIHAFFVNKTVSQIWSDEIQGLNFAAQNVEQNFSILDTRGNLQVDKLQRATEQMLEFECNRYIHKDINNYNDDVVELHEQLVDYTLQTLTQSEEGRLVVPLLWNGSVSNFLSKNKKLSKLILKSNLRKLQKDGGEKLALIDQTIKEQLKAGIIERVEHVDKYLYENPGYSFLPHMSIFKPEKETTKCRIVFLSNLCEKEGNLANLSHNQAMFSGPTLNQKLSSALLHLRFGKYLLAFDLKKAFNQLLLNETDQSKLLFYWYKDVARNDYSLVVYKNVRLSFGLRCSPFLLMISLFYILVIDTENDPIHLRNLKHLIYNLVYMDNCAITSDSTDYLNWAYNEISGIFSPYCFQVQQLITNNIELQNCIDKDYNESPSDVVKLFGINWNRQTDKLYTKPINLDCNANTKRTVLKSIASQFDIYNYNMPLLNRSRLYMHNLQCDKSLGWDDKLSPNLHREWVNICKQANAAPPVEVPRYIGPRNGNFKLFVFTDASHVLFGNVIYLYHEEKKSQSFVSAQNRIVNKQLSNKSIPALELNAITLGVEAVLDVYRDLTSPVCIVPINVNEICLFTDSLCCLHWLNSATSRLDKLTQLSTFVKNRLKNIQDMCKKGPVKFKFIEGERNPADCVTRCLSHKQLQKSNFLSGPNINNLAQNNLEMENDLDVIIPNPKFSYGRSINEDTCKMSSHIFNVEVDLYPSLLNPANFSSFLKLLYLYRRVLLCAQTWKNKVLRNDASIDDSGLYAKAVKSIIQADQKVYYTDAVEYLSNPKKAKRDIPAVVAQYNLFMDHDGIIRVKSKFLNWKYNSDNKFPVLLHKDSSLTDAIIFDIHKQLSHSGCYAVLSELRKNFFLPKHFSKINKFLKKCTHCKRFNARTLKLNQGFYRDFRENPPKIPFSNIFVDYLGPFNVRTKEKEKVWILCITCTWSRAVNLKVCNSLSLRDFIKAFQLHIYEYGVPQLFISDLGSQLSAGINVLKDMINDHEVKSYFDFHGVQPITFQQYFKGCSQLGSLVEVCVKMTKRLIFGSIKNNVIDKSEFEFLVQYIKHLINRRPIAFKDELRTSKLYDVPEPITPEHLIRGYETTSLNIIPELIPITRDAEWSPNDSSSGTVRDNYNKLQKIQLNIKEIYNQEFLRTLISQAVDKKDRFQPVTHRGVEIGDIVLLKESNTKPNHYPLAIVRDICTNSLGEVTGVIVFKGRTKELVKRHSSTIVPLLQCKNEESLTEHEKDSNRSKANLRPCRRAAIDSRAKTKAMLDNS